MPAVEARNALFSESTAGSVTSTWPKTSGGVADDVIVSCASGRGKCESMNSFVAQAMFCHPLRVYL